MPVGLEVVQRVGTGLVNLPNVVTLTRLCSVPLTGWLVAEGRMAWALGLFVAAALSDALDGWLARRFGGNAVGAVLDPLADKALLVTLYVSLTVAGILPVWLAIMVVLRDILIISGIIILSASGAAITIEPLYISKANTALQILLISIALLEAGTGIGTPSLMTGLVWLVAFSTSTSGLAYLSKAVRGELGARKGSR